MRSRFEYEWWSQETTPPIIYYVRSEISKFLVGKEMFDAFESSREFLMLLHKNEHEKLREDKEILDKIEAKYYEKFRNASYKYFKEEIIDNNLKNFIRMFLKDVKSCVISKHDVSSCGSIKLSSPIYQESHYKDYWNQLFKIIDYKRIKK